MKRRFGLMLRSKKIILLLVVTVAATVIVSTLIAEWLSRVSDLNVPSIGTITTVGVEAYWDKDLTNRTNAVRWGRILLGRSENVTVYLQSVSNTETVLSLTMGNLTFLNSSDKIVAKPSDSISFMNLKWNYNNTTVHPGETLRVILTLYADSSPNFIEFLIVNDVRAFSFDIHISTSEQS